MNDINTSTVDAWYEVQYSAKRDEDWLTMSFSGGQHFDTQAKAVATVKRYAASSPNYTYRIVKRVTTEIEVERIDGGTC